MDQLGLKIVVGIEITTWHPLWFGWFGVLWSSRIFSFSFASANCSYDISLLLYLVLVVKPLHCLQELDSRQFFTPGLHLSRRYKHSINASSCRHFEIIISLKSNWLYRFSHIWINSGVTWWWCLLSPVCLYQFLQLWVLHPCKAPPFFASKPGYLYRLMPDLLMMRLWLVYFSPRSHLFGDQGQTFWKMFW